GGGRVTATGAATEMGRVGRLVAETPHEATPLERAIEVLGRRLIWVIVVATVLVIAVGLWHAEPLLQMLETGVVLAIAAVPEGLPAVATISLAWGLQRLARRNAIVRRLSAVETLGSATVICTDKTGTLTENVITVQVIALRDGMVEVTGAGYDPMGSFIADGREINPADDPPLKVALEIGTLCNNAKLERSDRDGWHAHGDPVEAALLVAALKAGIDRQKLEWERPRMGEIPFEEKRKSMVTFNATAEGATYAYVKGAPSVVFDDCAAIVTRDGVRPLTSEDAATVQRQNRELAGRGLRVLGLAYKRLSSPAQMIEDLNDLIFVGLVGMKDPLRPNVKLSIARSRGAGIRTIMITGDQLATAVAVATELGLTGDGPPQAVEARDLQQVEAGRHRELLRRINVFARVTPEDKLRIVRALQENGEIVAMTGDGINDAPALRAAHIGIALGARGADVAKEAADVVIRDDNFSTIVLAIEQGRVIYANIRRAIRFLLTASFAAILATIFVIPMDLGLPLLPLQILWLNLLVHVFPAMALALEKGDPGVMRQPPRNPRESILPLGLLVSIAVRSALIGLVTAATFYWAVLTYGMGNKPTTFAFTVLALALMLHMLNLRSGGILAGRNHRPPNPYIWAALFTTLGLQSVAVYVPWIQQLLHTTPLTGMDLAVVAVAALIPFVMIEVVKMVRYVIQRRQD
ncbi:MAG: cation-transporting P-type ATPase, partial [Chloroflexi bacterium]|nr:cation-transporting P-type ATPase [Chloroflexota bacterium]